MSGLTVGAEDFVWAYILNDDTWPEMADEDGDEIYTVELNFEPGTEIQYFYAYGTWDIWDEEVVPAECSNEDGYRTHTVGADDEVLPAYLYGTCDTGTGGIYENSEVFAIFPNPAQDYVEVQVLKNFGTSEIILSDISGKIVYRNNSFSGSGARIDLQHLNAGVYIIHLNTEKGNYHHKILVSN